MAVYIDGGKHRWEIESLFHEFDKANANIKLNLVVYRGIEAYGDRVQQWFERGYGPDLVYWYGGQRIARYAQSGQLHVLDKLWQKHGLDQHFTAASKGAISYGGHIYAVPATTLLWSMYYNKKRLRELGLAVPTNWAELKQTCATLRERGLDTFAFGAVNTEWATHAWFDYLNLRLNGLKFHRELLDGKVSFQDERVKNTLAHWKQLLDARCFNQNYARLSLWDSFPRVVSGKSVFTLSEGVPQFMSFSQQRDISVAPFPQITEGIPAYTVNPTNVFVVPSYTEMSAELERLIVYISSKKFQNRFSKSLVRIPSRRDAAFDQSPLNSEVAELFFASPGGIQFFDRDTDIRLASKTPKIFTNFMQHKNIELTASELENLRQQVFVQSADGAELN
ncbi:ABC transporter substrate-binding protein [Agaribacterium haliotis]|uniref:ABC transporter substrate-binding protein n=1 Tax=Agaribacterium haliotis TaxID=2013869 RepID=UPI00130452FC|nr:extracellular solute-binding protein [Agaribacterium haliotis]